MKPPFSQAWINALAVSLGLAMLLCFGVAVWPLAQFLPPPTAHESAEQIARLYREHGTGIRLAALAMILGGILYFAFSIAIILQIQRVEGPRSPWPGSSSVDTATRDTAGRRPPHLR